MELRFRIAGRVMAWGLMLLALTATAIACARGSSTTDPQRYTVIGRAEKAEHCKPLAKAGFPHLLVLRDNTQPKIPPKNLCVNAKDYRDNPRIGEFYDD